MKYLKISLVLLLMNNAHADTILFVHGFMGNVLTFEKAAQVLQRSGWQQGGEIVARSPDVDRYRFG